VCQLIDLNVHPILADYVPRNRDALVTLVNLMSVNDSLVAFACGKEAMLKAIGFSALDEDNDVAWAFLVNITATKSLENKKKLVNCGIPLARLVSEKGLGVLRNICAGGPEHAALVEPFIFPALTLIASGLDATTSSVQGALDFLANIAGTSETNKSAISNDSRLLSLLLCNLTSESTLARVSAVRCTLNLVWAGEGSDDRQSATRSPMLRLVHARVMAAASRAPLRFTSMHASGTVSSSRQSKLVSFGFLEALQRVTETEEDDLVKETAREAVQLLHHD
jgi:hypothetical protein